MDDSQAIVPKLHTTLGSKAAAVFSTIVAVYLGGIALEVALNARPEDIPMLEPAAPFAASAFLLLLAAVDWWRQRWGWAIASTSISFACFGSGVVSRH